MKTTMYCMAVNVIAFVYSGFRGYDLIYQLTSGERKVRQPLCHYLDFYLDQVCQRRNDILLQAAIMVLMISVKLNSSFDEHGGEMQVAQDAPLKPSMDIFAVCQRRNDILLQAAIMVLMISVKVRLSAAIHSLRRRHN
ncbi:hypothetical protein Patl1_24398 [Pistacia atlantica]|uniref:Uncharacterized protein n=1 Tax=Pistacia atlantica TaxID=434234 RepID=A0ACC0ZXT2_9ROSI|nr:hypothetical protein Patl1_24398 [Pistacia atlantica]